MHFWDSHAWWTSREVVLGLVSRPKLFYSKKKWIQKLLWILEQNFFGIKKYWLFRYWVSSRPKLFYSKKKWIQNFFGIKKCWLGTGSEQPKWDKIQKKFPQKKLFKIQKNLCELLRANNYLLHLLFLGVNIDMIPYLIFFEF